MLFHRRKALSPAKDALTNEDVERAYDRGVHDERRRHRSHPILGAILLVAAAIGVGEIYLAARAGSFAGGGQVVDQKLASTSGAAQPAGQGARGVVDR
jgi:hypothetical protein